MLRLDELVLIKNVIVAKQAGGDDVCLRQGVLRELLLHLSQKLGSRGFLEEREKIPPSFLPLSSASIAL